MSIKAFAFVLAVLALTGQASAATAPAKAAQKPAAAKPAAGGFDARDPTSLIALLATMGAKGEILRTADGEVFMKVATPSFDFNAQYVGCDGKGRSCEGLAFSTTSSQRSTTLAQLNSFNQTSLTCRVFEDQAGKPHVMYSTLVSAADTREEMRTHIGVWQGCLSTFGLFLADPIGYLASAP